jgi:peptide-methionine (S)-S-oxide reductase
MTTDDRVNGPAREIATLGGGCFWCLEAVYQELRGVEKVESGYSGGHVPNPTQYRSVIFYHDDEQRGIAEGVISELKSEGIWSDQIVTEVEPFDEFYVAEDYHQNYFRNNGFQPYCQVIIAPKVARFRKEHLDRLKV